MRTRKISVFILAQLAFKVMNVFGMIRWIARLPGAPGRQPITVAFLKTAQLAGGGHASSTKELDAGGEVLYLYGICASCAADDRGRA